MTKTILATYDGEVLRPHQPLSVAAGTEVRIMIETSELSVTEEKDEPGSFLRLALSLNLDGPTDLSTRYHEYLYGRIDENDE